MFQANIIDMSHHNVVPQSLQPAKDSGILGIIHKATEGASFKDPKMEARYWLAREAGMLFGVYHFIRPGDPSVQLGNFLQHAKLVDHDQLLVALDYEDPKVELATVRWFMRALEQATQRSPLLYSGHVLKDKLRGVPDQELSQYRLWLAQYGARPVLPAGWSDYWAWQYTDQGNVPGIDPPTDLNHYRGSPAQLLAEWSGIRQPVPAPEPEEPGPDPEPEPAPEPDVVVRITVASSAPVKVIVEQVTDE